MDPFEVYLCSDGDFDSIEEIAPHDDGGYGDQLFTDTAARLWKPVATEEC